MNQDATLAQMRELKLAGMAQAFEALCLLPIDKQPASEQLLTQLLEAEELYRKNRKTMAGIKLAQFRYQASLEEITLSPERNLSKDLFHRLTDLSFAKKAENILITGATGCGKSFIATALGYQACQMGLRVGYFSLPKLLQRLHLAKADGSYVKELARIEKMQVIILDDWGLQPLDSYSRGAIMQIIEDRHGKHTTIITAQMPIAKWYEYIAEPTIADALMDRLLHHAHRIELKGESMRKKTLETPQNQTL